MPEEEEEDPKLKTYEQSGYESHYFMKNAGSLLVFILLQVALILLLVLCKPCSALCKCCKSTHGKVSNWLFFNPLLRLLLEATLDFSFSIFIQTSLMQENEDEEEKEKSVSEKFIQYNDSMVWIFIVVIGIMPIFVSIFLCCNRKKLQEPDFDKKYGALYTGLNLEKRSIVLYTPLFMLRRILFALVVCYMQGSIWIQLFFQFFCTLGF